VRDASSTNLAPALQHHLALGELADPDLGALQVGHDGHLATGALGGLAHQRGAVDMVLAVPWLKLSRTTLTPASIICSSRTGSLDAGPRVATILVARRAGGICFVSGLYVIKFRILTQFRLHASNENLPLAGRYLQKPCTTPVRCM
jgi:hypothetical protein